MTNPLGSVGSRKSLGFFPSLEGLRGLAVLAILVFHADAAWLPGGFLGVSTFFTLSGFLITRLLVAEVESSGRIDLAAFYVRRARRIFPAALAALLLVAFFGAFAADATQLARLRSDGLSALFYVANWWLIASGSEYASQLGSPSPIQHFWSLAIEEQFYLFFPGIVLLAAGLRGGSRARLAGVLGVLVLASWSWTAWLEASGALYSRLYYGSDTRCAELFAGSLLAVVWKARFELQAGWRRKGLATLGVAGAGVTAGFWITATPYDVFLYRGGLALYALSSVAILTAALLPVGPLRVLLGLPPLRWLGRISYGAYLYHWPIFLWLDAERTGLGPLALALLRLALTLGVSDLSYRLLEEPIRRGRWLHGGRLALAGVSSALVVAFGLILVTWNSEQVQPEPEIVAADEVAQPEARVVERPRPTRAGRRARVTVLGDSVAVGIGEALKRWSGSRRKLLIQVLAERGCGIASVTGTGSLELRRCGRWQKGWRQHVRKFDPEVVVVLTAGWDILERQLDGWETSLSIGDPRFDAWMRSEYEAATDLFASRGARVVFLTSPCIEARGGGAQGIFEPERTVLLNDTVIRPLARNRPDQVAVLDLFARVCEDDRVMSSIAGMQNVRPDGVHFSPEAAAWIAGWLGPELDALVEAARAVSSPAAPSRL